MFFLTPFTSPEYLITMKSGVLTAAALVVLCVVVGMCQLFPCHADAADLPPIISNWSYTSIDDTVQWAYGTTLDVAGMLSDAVTK